CWTRLSWNTSLPWSEKFIEKHIEKWNWKSLSWNTELPWSEHFVEKFIDKWNWDNLSYNSGLPWSESFIEKYTDKWNWRFFVMRDVEIRWNLKLVIKFLDKLMNTPFVFIIPSKNIWNAFSPF